MSWMQRYGNAFYLAAAVLLAAALGLGLPSDTRVKAQINNPSVTQKGAVVAGHAVTWAGTGQIQDGGAAGGTPWQTIKKTASQTVNNSTVLVNDNAMCFAVSANTTYAARMHSLFSGFATSQIDNSFSGPAAATTVSFQYTLAFGPNSSGFGTRLGDAISVDGTYTQVIILTVVNGVNAGTVCYQFSQTVAQANNTTVLAGSWMDWMSFP